MAAHVQAWPLCRHGHAALAPLCLFLCTRYQKHGSTSAPRNGACALRVAPPHSQHLLPARVPRVSLPAPCARAPPCARARPLPPPAPPLHDTAPERAPTRHAWPHSPGANRRPSKPTLHIHTPTNQRHENIHSPRPCKVFVPERGWGMGCSLASARMRSTYCDRGCRRRPCRSPASPAGPKPAAAAIWWHPLQHTTRGAAYHPRARPFSAQPHTPGRQAALSGTRRP